MSIHWAKEQLEADYKTLGTHAAIARIYGCSPSMVTLKMTEFGIKSLYDRSGSNNPKWKGGRRTDSNGYIQVYSPDHPNRTVRNEVPEHRLIMESILGRYLESYEVVHHKNETKDDNSPDNLELCEGTGDHVYLKHRQFRDKWNRLYQTQEAAEAGNQKIESKGILTDKQNTVLALLELGLDRGQIACEIGILRKTVHNHISVLRIKGYLA